MRANISPLCNSKFPTIYLENDDDAPETETAGIDHQELLFTVALAAAHNAPDIRQEKIEAIRAQIANGTYEIDAQRIAESIIRENPNLFQD